MSTKFEDGDATTASSPTLEGWTAVVTRPAHQADELVSALQVHGANVVKVPTIVIAPAEDGGEMLREAIRRLEEFDWVVFTSENAVATLCNEIPDIRALEGVPIAAVGEGTAKALSTRGVAVDLVPSHFVAESLVEAFPAARTGGKVLLPRAAVARDVVPDGLRQRGWEVEVVVAYRTAPAPLDSGALVTIRGADAITFTSSSTVSGYLAGAPASDLPPVVASIGPITSATARTFGIEVAVEADIHTSRTRRRAGDVRSNARVTTSRRTDCARRRSRDRCIRMGSAIRKRETALCERTR